MIVDSARPGRPLTPLPLAQRAAPAGLRWRVGPEHTGVRTEPAGVWRSELGRAGGVPVPVGSECRNKDRTSSLPNLTCGCSYQLVLTFSSYTRGYGQGPVSVRDAGGRHKLDNTKVPHSAPCGNHTQLPSSDQVAAKAICIFSSSCSGTRAEVCGAVQTQVRIFTVRRPLREH